MLYRIDHVAIDDGGQPHHATMTVCADSDAGAFEEGRRIDPRLSPGAEVYPLREQPFNLALHCHLESEGYTHHREPADLWDGGGAESGPMIMGIDEHDFYCDGEFCIACFRDGKIEVSDLIPDPPES